MPKVLLVSEGKHELAGALMNLVSRMAPADFVFECTDVRGNIHVHHGKGQGYFKRVVRWMLEAQKRGYNALVLVIDEDGISERVKELSAAQQYAGSPIRRALGVAIRTFDAWMLADERALSTVLQCTVPRQPDPESIIRPKTLCSQLLAAAQTSLSQTQMYASIALVVDLDVLSSRCPKGFAPFANRVREISY